MPLHPLIVHFPIALLVLGGIIEIVNVFLKSDFWNKVGTVLIIIGVITGVFSLLTGDGAESFAFEHWGRSVHDTVELHSLLANISVIIFGLLAVIKVLFKHPDYRFRIFKNIAIRKGLITTLIVILSIAGITTLATTGHLGGKIVYENQTITTNNK
ncbi:hypothetical protein PB01_02430 [Psychrobacillus glaciei]|uniref:DUF2231 domain-containing protein n=1 Tax=Psychrobacillus glaciei TaxID=2283160 RepID=A0A5J6SIU8_9BACI|nr:DUF2231 domain-containing protein [Psychrobacillus glaciei]QFF97758.1 hypothetical protein PB01_02430 [Psychrobacillus glaciei]